MPTREQRSDRESIWDGGHWCVGPKNGLGKAISKKDETSWVKIR